MDGLDQPRRKAPSLSGQEGRCLDCHGMDHSLMNGTQSFIYASDCINPQLGQLGDNDDAYRFWQRRMQSHRCPTHVGGENARSSPCTAENTLRVATTTTVATTTGTPIWPVSPRCPTTSLRQLRRHSTRWPTGPLANGLSDPARRAPSTFLWHSSTRYSLRVRFQLQPQRTPAWHFPHQLTTHRWYICTSHPADSTHGVHARPMHRPLRPRCRHCPFTARAGHAYRS